MTHLRPVIWRACIYHTRRDSFLWQPSRAHSLIPLSPSIPTPFFLSGKHGTNSLQNNESAPQGNVQVRKAFKKRKSQGLCISRPSCRASREEGGRPLPAALAQTSQLPPVSAVFPQPQPGQPTPPGLHPCHFQETRCSESILAFLWTHRNNSLTHRTERDDLVTFIFKMIKMQAEQFLWPTQPGSLSSGGAEAD